MIGVPILVVVSSQMTGHDFYSGALAGLGAGISLLLLYSSTRYLFVGISSAVSAVVSCVIPVVYASFYHSMSRQEVLGIVICVGALLAVGRWRGDAEITPAAPGSRPLDIAPVAGGSAASLDPPVSKRLSREFLGLGAALASGACMSLYYIALAGSSSRQQIGEAMTSRLVATSILLVIALVANPQALLPKKITWTATLPAGLFGMVGALSYASAVRSGTLGVIVPVVSMSPAVTIAIAWLALHERVSRRQVAGLLLAMVGVAIVTA